MKKGIKKGEISIFLIPVNLLLTFLGYSPTSGPPTAQGSVGSGWQKRVKEGLRSIPYGQKNPTCEVITTPEKTPKKAWTAGQKTLMSLWIIAFLGLSVLLYTTTLHVNLCESLPQRLFLGIKRPRALQEGDYVSFHNTWARKTFIKQIVGLPGDQILVHAGTCWLMKPTGQKILVGPVRSHTQDGRLLTPLRAQRIPQGFVFVQGTHAHSIDSRYAQGGLVALHHVVTKAIPLW